MITLFKFSKSHHIQESIILSKPAYSKILRIFSATLIKRTFPPFFSNIFCSIKKARIPDEKTYSTFAKSKISVLTSVKSISDTKDGDVFGSSQPANLQVKTSSCLICSICYFSFLSIFFSFISFTQSLYLL